MRVYTVIRQTYIEDEDRLITTVVASGYYSEEEAIKARDYCRRLNTVKSIVFGVTEFELNDKFDEKQWMLMPI